MSNKPKVGKDGIYDARQLGTPKMVVLGFQHMFAMFGATRERTGACLNVPF